MDDSAVNNHSKNGSVSNEELEISNVSGQSVCSGCSRDLKGAAGHGCKDVKVMIEDLPYEAIMGLSGGYRCDSVRPLFLLCPECGTRLYNVQMFRCHISSGECDDMQLHYGQNELYKTRFEKSHSPYEHESTTD